MTQGRFIVRGVRALGAEVPGPFTVASGVEPMARESCPSGGLYRNDSLCCIEVGGGNWRCRQVQGAHYGATSTSEPWSPSYGPPSSSPLTAGIVPSGMSAGALAAITAAIVAAILYARRSA